MKKRLISIVIPVYNEEENIHDLVERVFSVMAEQHAHYDYELILVDDGSTDNTLKIAVSLQVGHPCMKIIELRRNFGQTPAMAAGFDRARGDVIVPLDGDLQNDPFDIPRLVAKLDEGYDVVSGWRRDRKDKLISRKIPSWIANSVISVITGVRLHDYGCSLKAYHKDVVNTMNLYGDMHRFIPAVASWSGAKVTEMEVNHHPRLKGKTKYGINRTYRVILDLITIKFLGTFSTRPIHVFGGIGLLSMLFGFISAVVMGVMKIMYGTSMNRNPLLVISAMFMMMSVQFLLMGLLAEMLCRTYHESQSKTTYVIRNIYDSPSPKKSDN
ncbi:MAG: glycosyltransferase family 2 protein [Phycisphaerae bacterium]|nr:glycosyltransferase family 2 protein [Phycisphaerae bacterium]